LLAAVAAGRLPAAVAPVAPRAGAPEALTTRLSASGRRSLSPARTPVFGPARGRRRGVRQGLLMAAVPATALTAVLAAQLPGLTSTNDAAEGAGGQPGSPAPGCTARYDAYRSPDGSFTAELTVTEAGARTPGRWLVSFAVPAGQRLVASSGAVRLEQRADSVTIDVARTGSDGTATIGLRGRYGTGEGEPTDFALNGTPCGRASTSIVSTTTTTGAKPAGDGAPEAGPGEPASGDGTPRGRRRDASTGQRPSGGSDAGATPTADPSPSSRGSSAPLPPARTPDAPTPTPTEAPTQTPGPVETTAPPGDPTPTESAGGVPGTEPTQTS
ncbi:cellulose binding domain-containing protein, partial [Micromonospora sp. CPCC 205711]|uniref:cellulose binding domain-containing protein n=1 Tax=Micromonospora sp. CPCC 205547 TaxID=3122400 RepID=UPI002FF080F6